MLENREGQRVPEVTFKTRQGDRWADVTTAQLFAGKRVVVFALPGAYTPTCSSSHLPRYNELAPVFRKAGLDDIICLSVNDAFVMNEWRKSQEAQNVTLIPDGNGEFTRGMGMLVNKQDLGFGDRSWRYSMLVEDGVIKKMFIEPDVPGDPFQVSDADTMLNYVAPNAPKPSFFSMITRAGCPHCARAKALLQSKGHLFEEIELGKTVTSRSLRALSGGTTTPQVFHEGKLIGTADDLEKYFAH
jgi:glutaredoxin-like protein